MVCSAVNIVMKETDMRNWIGLGLSLCLGVVGVLVTEAAASNRSLSATELLNVRGGATMSNYCCKDQAQCAGTLIAITCSTPADNEDTMMPIDSRCSGRTDVQVFTTATKGCLGMESGKVCTYSTTPFDCKITIPCAWDDTALTCKWNVGAGTTKVYVPSTCTPNCTTP